MIQIKCIVADYHTWKEGRDIEGKKGLILTRLSAYHRTVEMKRFLNGNMSLWGFFFNKMFEACKLAKNNRGKLEKVYAFVKVYDDDGKNFTELRYIQENGGDLTRVIPSPEPLTALNKTVTMHKGPLDLTAAHIMKTAPKIVDYIKSKKQKRTSF